MEIQLTFITGNSGKAEQLSKYLGRTVNYHKLDLAEIQSLDLKEVIKHKAIEAYQTIKSPVIVDDTSLIINALGKLPGPFIKFFLQELGSGGICQLISSLPDKSATATVAIGYYDGVNIEVFLGETLGSISAHPQGTKGFGWDVLFVPNGHNQTRAEMNDQDYDNTSPRKKALEKFEHYLDSREI